MTKFFPPPCQHCLHQTAETFFHGPWVCEVFPDGLPRNIFYKGEECPHFEESKSTVAIDALNAAKKVDEAKPKPEPKKADKKLIRFQLPANPTAKDIDNLTKWVKEQ